MGKESSNLYWLELFFCDITFKVNQDSQPWLINPRDWRWVTMINQDWAILLVIIVLFLILSRQG